MRVRLHLNSSAVADGCLQAALLTRHRTALCGLQSPADVIDFSVIGEAMGGDLDADTCSGVSSAELYVHIANPVLDYVPPELVSLYVTDTGGYTPAYVYRLLAEYYSREDYMLSKELLDTLIR